MGVAFRIVGHLDLAFHGATPPSLLFVRAVVGLVGAEERGLA